MVMMHARRFLFSLLLLGEHEVQEILQPQPANRQTDRPTVQTDTMSLPHVIPVYVTVTAPPTTITVFPTTITVPPTATATITATATPASDTSASWWQHQYNVSGAVQQWVAVVAAIFGGFWLLWNQSQVEGGLPRWVKASLKARLPW